MPESHAGEFVQKLKESGIAGVIIGRMTSEETGLINVK
jgi:hypothetical protein